MVPVEIEWPRSFRNLDNINGIRLKISKDAKLTDKKLTSYKLRKEQ